MIQYIEKHDRWVVRINGQLRKICQSEETAKIWDEKLKRTPCPETKSMGHICEGL